LNATPGTVVRFQQQRPEALHTFLELLASLRRQFRAALYVNPSRLRLQFFPLGSVGAGKAREVCERKQQLAESLRVAMDDIIALSIRERELKIRP
jgi:hypothetical protein